MIGEMEGLCVNIKQAGYIDHIETGKNIDFTVI